MHSNIYKLVSLITSEIRSSNEKNEKWASFKKNHAEELAELLQLTNTGIEKPGDLIGIDFDDDRHLILLNYTSQAHNFLHNIENGWTDVLRQIRGLIFSFKDKPELVSRGFEKFFNYNELQECTIESLSQKYSHDMRYLAREKADGHMIEYFVHDGELCASTRGKFGTASSDISLSLFTLTDFQNVQKLIPGNKLMSIVVELVHPDTHVHVNYDETKLYLLALFDSKGEKYNHETVEYIGLNQEKLSLPVSRSMTIDEMIDEVNDRTSRNQEGWVMDFDGYLVKFKYVTYIGEMVKSKLSHKYIMNCIKNDRLQKMIDTLDEEIREESDKMIQSVSKASTRAVLSNSYKPLYEIYDPALDGSWSYFTQVCRTFWKEHLSKEVKTSFLF